MVTVRFLSLSAAVVLLAGCASSVRTGALSPIGARITNETVAADAVTLEGWTRRIGALQRSPLNSTPQRAHAVALAAGWVAFARDAYAVDPRDGVADQALDEARRLVASLDDGAAAAAVAGMTGVPRDAMWMALDSLRVGPVFASNPARFADAEMSMARAAMMRAAGGTGAADRSASSAAARQCSVDQQLSHAAQVIASLRNESRGLATARQPEFALAGVPTAIGPTPGVARSAPEPTASVRDLIGPIRLIVHFDVGSAKLTMESRAALDEVVGQLADRPAAALALEGYADHPGVWGRNPSLEKRRIGMVRQYLSESKVDLRRLVLAGVGNASAGSRTIGRGAGRKEITLEFIGKDGRTLTVAGAPTRFARVKQKPRPGPIRKVTR